MTKQLGQSLYLSLIKEGKVSIEEIEEGTPLFLSFHMEEEFCDTYVQEMKELCDSLNNKGCQLISDVSKVTLRQFACDIDDLIKRFHLTAVRIDYGFSFAEILEITKHNIVVLNASSMPAEKISDIARQGNVMAMHNFYPRKETGLDEEQFLEINEKLKDSGIKVLSFIPGMIKRGPLYEGLPTLEKQRYQNTYINYVEMIRKYHIDQVYLSEPGIDKNDLEKIKLFNAEDIISLVCNVDKEYAYLLNTPLTDRYDSPLGLVRVEESREYSKSNKTEIKARNNIVRSMGSICIDNVLYKRYCGEIQITKKDYPEDEKVNVIGKVENEYLGLLKLIKGKDRFILTEK